MLGSTVRRLRWQGSSLSSSIWVKDCSFQRFLVPEGNGNIGKGNYAASSIFQTESYANRSNNTSVVGLCSSSLETTALVLRNRGGGARRPRPHMVRARQQRNKTTTDTDTDAYSAIELALDSVVKIFTVSSSPNYFLPWQNKSQRESMGSGKPALPIPFPSS